MRKHARIVDLPGYWGNAAELGFYLAPSTVTVSNNTSMHPHHAAKVDSKDESENFFPPVCLNKLSALLLAGFSWSFS